MRHIILIFAILCASCSDYAIKPFSLDIQQGNVVTSKMMLQLRPGMNKSQVRFIMGTPLIQDSFHANRWDYFYQFRKGGKIVEQRRVILDFEQDALTRIRGDVVPAGSGEIVADPQPISNSAKTSAKQPQKRGWLDKLQFWKEDKDAEQPQAAPADLVKQAPADLVNGQKKQPAATQAAPAKAPSKASQPASTPEPAQLPPAPPAEAAPVTQKPARASEPVVEPAPQQQVESPAKAKPEPSVAKSKPQQEAAPKPVAKPAPAPEPEKDLPPEDEPGYFERMLEKIGF